MKKLALFAGCLVLLACSSDGGNAGPGHGGQGGGQAGNTGGSGTTGGAGTSGSAGTSGNAGTTGSAGTTGGAGTGGGGTTGGGGQAGGSTGSGGRGGTTGSAGTSGGAGTTGGAGGGGKGGSSGAGGQAGKAGQGGTGGIQSCPEWETQYAKALRTARACNASLSIVQCATLASSKLACGCPMYVNDSTELDTIRAEWLQSSCSLNVICPAIACPVPGKAACVLMNSGDFCVSAVTPTPAN